MTQAQDNLEQFKQFISRARGLVEDANDDCIQFREFVGAATPLLVGNIRASLPIIEESVARISRWLTPHDLLAISGYYRFENPYTELIAWALRPGTHAPSAAARQGAWLSELGISIGAHPRVPTDPVTQLVTDDGVPDLVLRYDDLIVVVEAKTESQEHKAPSNRWQSEAYPAAVRRKFALPIDFPVETFLLSIEGDQPKSTKASPTTYLDFCGALIIGLEGFDLDEEIRQSFRMLISHFMQYAAPNSTDLPGAVKQFGTLGSAQEWNAKPHLILKHIESLEILRRFLEEAKRP